MDPQPANCNQIILLCYLVVNTMCLCLVISAKTDRGTEQLYERRRNRVSNQADNEEENP